MIRFVTCLVDGKAKRYVLHAFTANNAIVEDPKTGQLLVRSPDSLTLDPPTLVLEDQQMQQQMRRQAANPGGFQSLDGKPS